MDTPSQSQPITGPEMVVLGTVVGLTVAAFSAALWGNVEQHIDRHNGRIDVADPRLAFRRVSLERLPDGWAAEASKIATAWRPHTPQSQSGSTISSPSP